MSIKPTTVPSKKLLQTINGSSTSFQPNNVLGWDGVVLTDADFGTQAWAVFRNSANTLMEIMEIDPTTVDTGTITILKRGLKFTGDDATEVAANKLTWIKGDTTIELGSHVPQLIAQYAALSNDNVFTGLNTFTQTPLGINAGGSNDASTTAMGINEMSSATLRSLGVVTVTIATPAVFTLNNHNLHLNDRVRFTTTGALPTGLAIGTNYYVISAGLTANNFRLSTSQGGTAINTTGSQSGVHTLFKNTPVAVSDTDYRFGANSFGVDSGTANAHVVTLPNSQPTSYSSGQIFSYIVNITNTTAVTTNIAGMGAKTVKKLNGATDLVAGDLVAGMLIELEYNATSGFFVLLSPVANVPATPPSVTDVQVFSTAGTFSWTKPTGAKWVEVFMFGGGGAGGSGTPLNNQCGGAAGAYAQKAFDANALGATESVTVGAAGVAGANNTAGGAGGFSSFGTTVYLRADGGGGGSGSGTIGGATSNGDIRQTGGNSGTGPGAAPSTAVDVSPRGGGGGGYNGGSPATATAGGAGGGFTGNYVLAGGAGGAAGVNNGQPGNSSAAGIFFGGTGGGGGGYNGNGTNTGGNGGAGGFPGGGGGGSVGTNNVGGNGARGCVTVITYF